MNDEQIQKLINDHASLNQAMCELLSAIRNGVYQSDNPRHFRMIASNILNAHQERTGQEK